MKIPYLLSINNEMPVRVRRFRLDPVKAQEFNSGKYKNLAGKEVAFARNDYKYLWELDIDRGKTYIKVATPDFRQVLYSIRVLWNAKDGQPYDRHGHPVVMQAFDIDQAPMESTMMDSSTRKKVVRRFQKTYAKNKG